MSNDFLESQILKSLLEDLRASQKFGIEFVERIEHLVTDNLLTDAEAVYKNLKQPLECAEDETD